MSKKLKIILHGFINNAENNKANVIIKIIGAADEDGSRASPEHDDAASPSPG